MKKIYFAVLFAAAAFLASCNNGLLPMSVSESGIVVSGGNSRNIEPPPMVTATKGRKQKIILDWSSVSKAITYNVYASPTPFDTFVKIGETKNNSYTYNISPGLTRYFKITAVNYLGIESESSMIVTGASLACPVITELTTESDSNNEHTTTTINWYMENAEQYSPVLQYELVVSGGSEEKTFQIDGSDTSNTTFSIQDLPSLTALNFQISAFLSSSQTDVETSLKVNLTTHGKLTPDAVTTFKASKGDAPDKITLNFNLPEVYNTVTGTTDGISSIEMFPLKFKIWYKKETEAGWTLLTGSGASDFLYCNGNTTKPNEDNYVPGNTITYKATGLSAGTIYNFKIQSYVYDSTTNSKIDGITSGNCVAETSGWTMGKPSLVTKDFEYQTGEFGAVGNQETKKVSASLEFGAVWDNFGNEDAFKFILEETFTDLDNNPSKSKRYFFNTISEINNYKKLISLGTQDIDQDGIPTFTSDQTEEGYYTYKIFVVDASTTEETKDSAVALTEAPAPGTILVCTEDIPTFANWNIQDGFSSKVKLSWQNENSSYTYTVSKYPVDKNHNKTGDEIIINKINNSIIKDSDTSKIWETEDTVESGLIYAYTLYADYTTSSGKDRHVPSDTLYAETLGTPVIEFAGDEAKYSSITWEWKPVQKADSYKISLLGNEYSWDSSQNGIDGSTNAPEITYSDNKFTFQINKPEAYNNSTESGKDWTAKVEAFNTNNTEDNKTENSENVFTLGPARTNVTAEIAKWTDNLSVSWDKVKGAKAYAVIRIRCELNGTPDSKADADVYIVSANPSGKASDVKYNGNNVDPSMAKAITSEGKIVLTDIVKEMISEGSAYEKNQDMLGWGYPFQYTVLPLESENDDIDGSKYILGDKNQAGVEYQNINSVSKKGSTRGHGINVKATKSEDPRKINISWERPYFESGDNPTPYLWYSESGKNNWKLSVQTEGNCQYITEENIFTAFDFTPPVRTGAYDFAVTYKTNQKPQNAYLNNMNNIKDTIPNSSEKSTENLNKGYAFSIELSASNISEKDEEGNTTEGFTEMLQWTLWDYSKRAVGPESNYVVSVFNNDYSTVIKDDSGNITDDGWRKVCDITKEGVVSINNPDAYNTEIVNSGTNLTIKPKTVNPNTDSYDGLLKVLRDYKHYAKITATRNNSDGNPITASFADGTFTDENFSTYTYRKIRDAELARCVSLIVADAIYQAGISSGGDRNCDGQDKDTSFLISHPGASKTVKWGTNSTEYRHIFRGGCKASTESPFNSSFTIKINNADIRSAADGNSLYMLPEAQIDITHSEPNLKSYKGKISLTIGEQGHIGWTILSDGVSKKWILTIKKDGKTLKGISQSNETQFKYWFPYTLGEGHDEKITSYNPSAAVVYTGVWW